MRSVLVVVLVVMLSGCHGDPPPVTPAPTPSVTPVFASDEEALAAAEEAYSRYTAVEDAIAQDGGSNVDRLADLVTVEWLEHERDAFAEFEASGLKQVGYSSVTSVVLQQVANNPDGTAEVTVYACVDFSRTSFVDSGGSPQDPTGSSTVTLEARFKADGSQVLLAGSELWSESIC